MNYADLDGEFGLSSYNQPLNNTTTLVWELPIGSKRRWGGSMSPAFDAILGGWRVTAINTMASGRAVNLSYSPSGPFTVSTVPTYRPNLTGDIYAPGDQRRIDNYFDRDHVVIPTDSSQPFGNAPRNAARSTRAFPCRVRRPVWSSASKSATFSTGRTSTRPTGTAPPAGLAPSPRWPAHRGRSSWARRSCS